MRENKTENRSGLSIADLIELARQEKWEEVDGVLPTFANRAEVLEWATKSGLYETDGNLRDLACSILQTSNYKMRETDMKRLRELMGGDENKFVRYRAAFALFHNGIHSEDVIEVIEDASGDKDVGVIANKYLEGLQKKK